MMPNAAQFNLWSYGYFTPTVGDQGDADRLQTSAYRAAANEVQHLFLQFRVQGQRSNQTFRDLQSQHYYTVLVDTIASGSGNRFQPIIIDDGLPVASTKGLRVFYFLFRIAFLFKK